VIIGTWLARHDLLCQIKAQWMPDLMLPGGLSFARLISRDLASNSCTGLENKTAPHLIARGASPRQAATWVVSIEWLPDSCLLDTPSLLASKVSTLSFWPWLVPGARRQPGHKGCSCSLLVAPLCVSGSPDSSPVVDWLPEAVLEGSRWCA
jgi:hypothetical protein